MDHNHLIDVLNRLFQVHHRSLPVYVQGTRPWTPPGQQEALDMLAAVAADQGRVAERIAEAIQEEGGRLDPGQFPVAFTAIHDLSADFLLRRAAEIHLHDLNVIQRCAAELSAVSRLRPLVEETLQQARRHQELLQGGMKEKG